MKLDRRMLIGGAAAVGGSMMTPGRSILAQDGTLAEVDPPTSGYGIVRVRQLPTAELSDAIYPDVMARFLPPTAALSGFQGYVLAFDDQDPTATISLTLLSSENDLAAADAIAANYVSQLDERFVLHTPIAEEGMVRILTEIKRPANELPPFLHGTWLALRHYTDAPGAEEAVEASLQRASESLAPLLGGLDGFVMYVVLQSPGVRVAINLWESAEHLEAGDKAVEAWRGELSGPPNFTEFQEFSGSVGYSMRS